MLDNLDFEAVAFFHLSTTEIVPAFDIRGAYAIFLGDVTQILTAAHHVDFLYRFCGDCVVYAYIAVGILCLAVGR